MAVDYELPPAETVYRLSESERAAVLDHLFEPSPALHDLFVPSLQSNQFTNYQELISLVEGRLRLLIDSTDSSETATLDEILGGHPRLGAKKVESTQSQAEQAQLKSSNASESQKLADMNDSYGERFPGLRFVTFVSGRSRSTIMEEMQRRVDRGDINAERHDAVKAICDIAFDRAQKLSAEA